MNANYMRFSLEKYYSVKTRHHCPRCGRKNEFTRYIDNETGDYLGDNVGRCNHELSCGYHFTPKQFFEINPELRKDFSSVEYKTIESKKLTESAMSTISPEVFFLTIKNKRAIMHNFFIKYLLRIFDFETVQLLVEKYYIGSAKHWEGAVVFWQVDRIGRIRTGKIMSYDPITGKRIKKGYDRITWAHKLISGEPYDLKQCLFGEHLLNNNNKFVLIVEGEKKAIIASVLFPGFVVLSCGGLSQLSTEKMAALKGRIVVLLPDVGCFDIWQKRSEELYKQLRLDIYVSDFMERKAKELSLKRNDDIVDYLEYFLHKILISL